MKLHDEYGSESKSTWGLTSEIVHAITGVLGKYGLEDELPEFATVIAVAKKIAAKRWKEEK